MNKSNAAVYSILSCALLIFSFGCGTSEKNQTETSADLGKTPEQQTAPVIKPVIKQEGVRPDGTLYLRKDGLLISTTEPTNGAAAAAWNFFKLRGEHKYEESCEYLTKDRYTEYHDTPGQPYLREVTQVDFLRWTDVTSIYPTESEDAGAYAVRIIYLEMNFQLRGNIAPENTGMRNGKNNYALHVIQEKKGDPWKISLLAGCPRLEE